MLTGLAGAFLGGLVALLASGPAQSLYLSQTPLLVALAMAAGIFGAIARALFRRARQAAHGATPAEVDFSHTYRPLSLLALLLVVGAGGRQLLIPKGFGMYGHYRPEAVAKARALPSRHKGDKGCKGCHPGRYSVHAKGMHRRVECEVCHGPGDRHAINGDKGLIQKNRLSCLVCHRRLVSRPENFPQIDLPAHLRSKGFDPKVGANCGVCHDPHQPLFVDQAASTARVHHPVSHQCRDCHAHMPSNTPKPQSHPMVFDCDYCHADKAKAVAERPHRHLRCRSCHKLSRAERYFGYIIRSLVKNRDRRFCLLCHAKRKGHVGSKPPVIEWKKHLQQMAGDLKSSCVDCHQDKIHPVRKHQSRAHPGTPPHAPGKEAVPMSRPEPVRRPPPRPESHRGSARHRSCNRACHSQILPRSHADRPGSSCGACHR